MTEDASRNEEHADRHVARRPSKGECMRAEALFINGVFEEVLREILKVQSVVPEQILFLHCLLYTSPSPRD